MAYAGVFSILQTYKMQKADSDFKLVSLSGRIETGSSESDYVNQWHDAKQNDLDQKMIDEPEWALTDDCKNEQKELDKEFEKALAEIAGEEDYWQSQMDAEQTKNAVLGKNVENFQKMLEANIASSHTYGYQS